MGPQDHAETLKRVSAQLDTLIDAGALQAHTNARARAGGGGNVQTEAQTRRHTYRRTGTHVRLLTYTHARTLEACMVRRRTHPRSSAVHTYHYIEVGGWMGG